MQVHQKRFVFMQCDILAKCSSNFINKTVQQRDKETNILNNNNKKKTLSEKPRKGVTKVILCPRNQC